MLDYIWSISDEAFRDDRNQPPKPECLSGSATYAFACVAPSRRRLGGLERLKDRGIARLGRRKDRRCWLLERSKRAFHGGSKQLFAQNKANKLLKTKGSVPESDKTIPMPATFGASRFESKGAGL